MKISIIAGGRFHAFHLAHQLIKQKALHKLYTFSYTKKDTAYVPKKFIRHFRLPSFIDKIYQKARLYKFIPPSQYNVFKDNMFDQLVSEKIDPHEADIFVFWAHYGLKSIHKIKAANPKAIIIIESGSCHIVEQQKLLENEYLKAGFTNSPVCKENSEKMLAEYEIADIIMTPSSFVKKSFLRQNFPPAKIAKVPYGANINLFSAAEKKENSSTKFRVIFVGLLSLQKGVHYLLEAWKKLNLPAEKAELLLVGSWRNDLKHFLADKKQPENVIFYGGTTQQKLKELYQSANLFVLPSVQEGLAMVTGEAMASGLPVVCSMHTGADELITDGKEGFLVPVGDSNALAEKIMWCYNHQEEAALMGKAGSKTIQKFSWDRYGENVYQTYRKILDNGTHSAGREI